MFEIRICFHINLLTETITIIFMENSVTSYTVSIHAYTCKCCALIPIVTGKLIFIYAEQINLFKPAFGINDIPRKKQNYCHTCHTRFATYVVFPLLSCCVSSLSPKRSKKQPWASKMSELHELPPPPCKKAGIQVSFFPALLVTSDNS